MPYRFLDSLPYLLNRIGTRLGELFGARLAEHGLSVPMYRVLAVLRQEGPQTLSDLARLATIETSTLSRLVGRLVRRGLVLRVRPEENGRIVRIELAAEGKALAAAVMPIAIHYERRATAGLGDADRATLERLLRQVARNLEASTD